MKNKSFLLLLAFALAFSACKKDESLSPEDQLTKDIGLIEQYLTDHDLVAESTSSGLHYIIETPGIGEYPTVNSTVTVQYKGYLLNGNEFDSGTSTFPLANVIQGWVEGIPKFKKLGRGKLLIPSGLAYGPMGSTNIAANTVLIFDIHLISFNN